MTAAEEGPKSEHSEKVSMDNNLSSDYHALVEKLICNDEHQMLGKVAP